MFFLAAKPENRELSQMAIQSISLDMCSSVRQVFLDEVKAGPTIMFHN